VSATKEAMEMGASNAKSRRATPLATPTGLGESASKKFHWHMSGPHFRDYHLLLDEHATQIFATTDTIAGRGRHPT
jgi:starvation-inducible DNA-binding protein